MDNLLSVFGAALMVLGAAFLLLGGLGLVRMPDVFNQIQAGTKATTLGTLLSLGGAACLQPDWTLKLMLIGLFILFTNPLSSQVMARSAHRTLADKTPLTTVDRLAEDTGEKQ